MKLNYSAVLSKSDPFWETWLHVLKTAGSGPQGLRTKKRAVRVDKLPNVQKQVYRESI